MFLESTGHHGPKRQYKRFDEAYLVVRPQRPMERWPLAPRYPGHASLRTQQRDPDPFQKRENTLPVTIVSQYLGALLCSHPASYPPGFWRIFWLQLKPHFRDRTVYHHFQCHNVGLASRYSI